MSEQRHSCRVAMKMTDTVECASWLCTGKLHILFGFLCETRMDMILWKATQLPFITKEHPQGESFSKNRARRALLEKTGKSVSGSADFCQLGAV